MNKEKTYNGNLNVGRKTIRLETDINYQAIEIEYLGTIQITSLLPSDYILSSGRNKIIIVKMVKDNNIITDLFTYKGMAMITKCRLITSNLKSHNLYVNKLNLELWDKLDGTWENLSNDWENISFDGDNNKKNYMHRKAIYDKETNTYTTTKEIRKK